MSKCQDLEPLFAPYVDGDAPAHDRSTVEAHLDRCPPCRERLDAERTAHQLLVARRAELRGCASARLRATCAGYARQGPAGASPFHHGAGMVRKWLPLSLAATLLLAIAGAFFYGLNDSVEALAAQLTLDHDHCFQLAPERLEHADAAIAGRAWAAAHGWALQVPPSSAARELELLGVRRCVMSAGGVAHVLYKWHGEPLSVFVVPGAPRRGGRELHEIAEGSGREALVWSDGERTYVVVGRGRPADLEAVAAYVKSRAH
jgi:anti-sigma factor RsiW